MHIAALDIGGIKTIVTILDESGGVSTQENFPSITARHETYLELCVQAMKRLMHRTELQVEDFTGLGMLLPGIVDNKEGILLYAPYAGWENVGTAGHLSKNLGVLRVQCENNVNACAIGEKRFGLGNNYTDFIWMTVSTDVGGATVEGSKLVWRGLGFAGKLGHLEVEHKSPAHCPYGQYGCLEAHGSGIALTRETGKRRLTSPAFAKALDEMGLKLDGAGYVALARVGDTDALNILSQVGTYLGRGTSYCINTLNIQAVMVSGGVVVSLDLLLPSIRISVQQNVFKQIQGIDIVKTPLGYKTALLEAAALVLKR